MYGQISFPVLVIQKFTDSRLQIDKFNTPEDGIAFYDFIKNYTDLRDIEDLRLCMTVLQYNPEGELKCKKDHRKQ